MRLMWHLLMGTIGYLRLKSAIVGPLSAQQTNIGCSNIFATLGLGSDNVAI